MNKNFADRLLEAVDEKKNPSVAGLDPAVGSLPQELLEKYRIKSGPGIFRAAAEAVLEFNRGIIDALYDVIPAVKLQSAYYEQLGPDGMQAFLETSAYAKSKGLVVIADVKRNDIGSTCQAYSAAFIGRVDLFGEKLPLYDADALTVNSYLGYEGMQPFIDDCRLYGKGLFALVKTSNPGSEEFQMLRTDKGLNYEVMGQLLVKWGKELEGERGYSPVGAVVGATFPAEAEKLRSQMKNTIFLVPGYGAQGGGASDAACCFNSDGQGAIINSSRGIIFAYMKKKDSAGYQKHARDEALRMKKDITDTLREKGICRWLS